MNNFDLRNKYINKLWNEMQPIAANNIGRICEEFIIVECSKNEYAMKYVNKVIENIENKHQYILNAVNKYDVYGMFSFSFDKQIEITSVMTFFQYCEEINDMATIDNLMKKAFKKDYNDFLDKKYHSNADVKNRVAHLFLLALHNTDISIYSKDCKLFLTDGVLDVFEIRYVYKPTNKEIDNIKDIATDIIKKYKLTSSTTSLREIEDKNHDESFEKYKNYKIQEMNLFFNDKLKEKWLDETIESLIEDFDKVRYKYTTKEINEISYIHSNIIEILENSDLILKHKISKDDILYAISVSSITAKEYNLDIKKDSYLILISLLIKIFSDKLNEYTKQCVSSWNKQLFVESKMYELNKAHEKEINEIKTDNISLVEKNKSLEDRIAELERENNLLKSKINKNLDKNKKENKDKKELESLRSLFFSLEHEEIETSEIIEDINIKDIDEKKIAFIGSNDILHSRLKNKFKNFTYITADEETRDLNFIRNMNHIFLHTHSPHSLYYKVLELIKPYNVGLTFINSTNVDIISNIVVEELKKKEAI